MSTNQTLQRTDPEKAVEFVPYGAADKIKLSVKIIQNMVAVPTKSGKTCTERDALRFLMLCQAQRLNPFAGDAFLVGYDGQQGPTFSLITAHQAFLKRAETCPDFEGMESGVILKDADDHVTEREGDFHLDFEDVVGGWARVHRKGRKDTYRRVRLSRFNTGYAQWKTDPAGMIVKCAEADALRSTFPTLLGGLYIQGEQADAGRIVSDIVTTKPIFEAPTREIAPTNHSPQATPSITQEPADLPQKNAPGESNPPPAPSAKPVNFLRAINGLMKSGNVKESELLAFMRGAGLVDDSPTSLEEIAMISPSALEYVHEKWAMVDKDIKAQREGK